MGKVKQKIQEVADTVGKTIRTGVEKIRGFRKTPIGQNLEQAGKAAGLEFLRQTGLGKQGVDLLNKEAEKFTKGFKHLDAARELGNHYAQDFFQAREPLPQPKYDYGTGRPTFVANPQTYQPKGMRPGGGRYIPRKR